jgi:hypothetical protein
MWNALSNLGPKIAELDSVSDQIVSILWIKPFQGCGHICRTEQVFLMVDLMGVILRNVIAS